MKDKMESGESEPDSLKERQAESHLILMSQGYCAPGNYPWDFWQERALAAGVSKELAIRGREVMRESHQHQWRPLLKHFCGWVDAGETMITLALEHPERARAVWKYLMETDGLRGWYHPQTGEWVSWE